jgi:broad specificity phosphatase PhoE
MPAKVLLVRHTEVARAWQGRCYGQSDMGLSRTGAARVRSLAPELADWHPNIVLHSGLRRARILAEAAAILAGVTVKADPMWMERDFGNWEGRSWAAIYRETGNAMDGMIDDPEGFRSGNGETTMELAGRSLAALRNLPSERVLVVTHGGPIAAIMGTLQAVRVHDWPALVPAAGTFIEVSRPNNNR